MQNNIITSKIIDKVTYLIMYIMHNYNNANYGVCFPIIMLQLTERNWEDT